MTGNTKANPNPIQVVRLGTVDYRAAWELQRRLVVQRRAGELPDLLLLLEHPPTYTIGKRGTREHLLIDDATLDRLGARCYEVDRGGDITFHGPGQIVAYPIIDLSGGQRRVRRYVDRLERVVIGTLATFGIQGRIDPGYPGVWVGNDKIAALGVAIRHAVTFHGFALNVDPDMRYFDWMIPCGISDTGRGTTSLRRELDGPVSMAAVLNELERNFAEVFERPLGHDLRSIELLRGESNQVADWRRSPVIEQLTDEAASLPGHP